MNDTFSDASAKVLAILDNMEKEETDKISKEFINFLKQNASKSFLDTTKPINELELTSTTKALLGIIYYKFWANEEEKKAFINGVKNNESNYQGNQKQSEIFNKSSEKSSANIPQVALIKNKKDNFLKKIINKIKKFFVKDELAEDDVDKWIQTIKQNPYAIEDAPEEIKNNPEVNSATIIGAETTNRFFNKNAKKIPNNKLGMLINRGIGTELLSTSPIDISGKSIIATESIESINDKYLLDTPIVCNGEIPTRVISVYNKNKLLDKWFNNENKNEFNTFTNKLHVKKNEENGIFKDGGISEPYNVSGVTALGYNNAKGISSINSDINPSDSVDIYYTKTKLICCEDLPAEQNEELLMSYFNAIHYDEKGPVINTEFIENNLEILLNCFDGKDNFINFITKYAEQDKQYGNSNCSSQEYIDYLSKKIDETLEEKSKQQSQYKSSDFADLPQTADALNRVINVINDSFYKSAEITEINLQNLDGR